MKTQIARTFVAAALAAPMMTVAEVGQADKQAAPVVAESAEVSAESVRAANEMAKDAPRLKASAQIKKEMKAWKKKHGIVTGVVKKGAIYLESVQKVSENAGSPRFVMARAAAFEEAYLDALSGYVMDKSGQTSFETANRFFMDGSSDRDTPPKNLDDAVARITSKASQLAVAKLDAALKEMGVPVAEYEKKDIVAKRQLFLESILTKSIDEATDEAVGISVVTTFEGNDDAGNYAIGVILRGGVDTEVIAECLREKRRPVMVRPDMAAPVDELLPPEEDIAQEFGVRVVFDEKGVPALLSFGQAGYDYTGKDEDEEDDFTKLALEQAEGQANDQLTMFINSQIHVKNERSRGKARERVLEFDSKGIPTKKSIRNYVSRMTKAADVSGSDTMIGRSTVFKELVPHPHAKAHQVAVCVRMWSFDQFDAMSGIKNRPRGPVSEQDPVVPVRVTPGARRGRTYDF